jgi:hypothetical protein
MTVRWDYPIGVSANEAQTRRDLELLVEAWWSAFVARSSDLSDLFGQRSQWDLPEWMSETLEKVDRALMWEFGPAVRSKGHRLVITPEVRRDLRPLVRYILSKAPELSNWEFYGHRLPGSVAKARETVEARCGEPGQLSDAIVAHGENHRINLMFRGPHVEGLETIARNEALILAEALLGEEVLDCWIGEVDVSPLPKRGLLGLIGLGKKQASLAIPLESLRAEVLQQIRAIQSNCGDVTVGAVNESWSLLELHPKQLDDYPSQEDLFVGKTANVARWRAAHAEGFYDERFGAAGETFCYLKLDGADGLDEEMFADKGAIEDALDAVLRPAGWGRQVGGGTGLRYSYIELVLKNTSAALPAIRKVLQEGNVPRRSWLLFHSCEKHSEWVGIYDDTPAPP